MSDKQRKDLRLDKSFYSGEEAPVVEVKVEKVKKETIKWEDQFPTFLGAWEYLKSLNKPKAKDPLKKLEAIQVQANKEIAQKEKEEEIKKAKEKAILEERKAQQDQIKAIDKKKKNLVNSVSKLNKTEARISEVELRIEVELVNLEADKEALQNKKDELDDWLAGGLEDLKAEIDVQTIKR